VTRHFGVQNNLAISPMPLPINNFDNSKQHYFNFKGIYSLNRNWSFTAGYSYLKFNHNDIATDGYQYVAPLVRNTGAGGILPSLNTNTSLSYLSGYDAFTNGHANIFYLTVTYKFDAPPLPPAPARRRRRRRLLHRSWHHRHHHRHRLHRRRHPPLCNESRSTRRHCSTSTRQVLKPEGKAAIDSQVVWQAQSDREARSRPRDRPYRPPRNRRAQPGFVVSAAPMRYATTSSSRAYRATRSRRSAWRRNSRWCSVTRRIAKR
jgi:hypothetical protein